MLPIITFCTTCKGRAQHLKETLPQNIAERGYYRDVKFVILDYNSPDDLVPYLWSDFLPGIESGLIVVYHFREPGPFRMAHAKNMAHRAAIREGADILVNLDADNFTGPDFAAYVAAEMDANSFLWSRMVKNGPGRLSRGISGRIAVTRNQFLEAGGYDEQFNKWSPDDKDFNLRLQRMGFQPREIDPMHLKAVPHNDKMRFREYPEANDESYEFEAVALSDTTVANFGDFGCGTVYRNFDFEHPIQFEPMPTRIFGIGMHKTATTSLHAALKILGFDSGHWESAHWAKAIWEEMQASSRSHTLERFYALSDLPIPLLYRELDLAYPGSKFVLTTRNEDAWLASVRNHWSPEHNKFRDGWNTDPFTHRVHKLMYGQKGFDEDVFCARYRRHNAEVLDYFKDRPNDLLEMDMDAGAGWNELCGFLNLPRPTVDYPRRFNTSRQSNRISPS